MLNNLNNSTSTAATNTGNLNKDELDIYRLVKLNFKKLENLSVGDLNEQIDDLISHLLAHALLNNTDSDLFLSIYDKIPAEFSQIRIEYIKNKSLEISELEEEEFKLNCLNLNCDYSNFLISNHLNDIKNNNYNDIDVGLDKDNKIDFELNDNILFVKSSSIEFNSIDKMNDSNNNKNNKINNTGDIILNEQFFNDKQNKLNSNINPLLSCNNNNNNNNQNANNITVINQKLLNSMLDDDNNKHKLDAQLSKSTNSFNLPPLTSATSGSTNISAISRDGFVTNQRYQTLKDNKRSESQLTTCYDEVYTAKSDDNVDSIEEDDDNEIGDDDELNASKEKKRSDSFSSNSSSSSSSSSIKSKKSLINTQEAVVINMNEDNDDEDYMDDNFSINYKTLDGKSDGTSLNEIGKEKFESLVNKKELEMNSHGKMNELKEMTPSDAIYENKYEQDEKLLKNYENECRYGLKSKSTVNPERYTYFNYSRNLSNNNMKNDFSKNADEEDNTDYYNRYTKIQLNTNRSSASSNIGSNIQTKVLLNNKKPPYPSTSTSTTSLTTNSIGTSTNNNLNKSALYQKTSTNEESNDLLDCLVFNLKDKFKDKLPAKSSTQSKLQINNYENKVDDLINLNLNSNMSLDNEDNKHEDSSWNYLTHTSTSTSATSMLATKTVCNNDIGDAKNKSGSTSSTSSNSSSTSSSNGTGFSCKLGNSNRRSNENNMDSHGSSLTNSSKQDDEEDEYDDENEEHDELISDDIDYNKKINPKNISYNNPINKKLHDTIEELGQRHVNETLNNNKTSNLSTFRPSDSTKLPPLKGITPKGAGLPLPNISSTSSSTYPINLNNNNNNNNNNVNKTIGNNNSGAFHKKYSNLGYDPNSIGSNVALTQPDPTVKNYNTFNNPIQTSHLDSSNDSKLNQINSKNTKRMNKKNKSKGSIDLNNSENTNEFSKHYTEDVNSLLEFINSSSSNTTNVNDNKNKTVKNQLQNKKEKSNKANNINNNTNEKAQVKTQNNDNKDNKISNKKKSISNNETKPILQKDMPSNEIEDNENIESKKPEIVNDQAKLAISDDVKATEKIKKVLSSSEMNSNKEILNQVVNDPSACLNIEGNYDELNNLMESTSIKSNDDEFVIVKGGRKSRKSNKPNENNSSTQTNTQPKISDNNKNKNSKTNKIQQQVQQSQNKQDDKITKQSVKSANQSSLKITNISFNKVVKKDELIDVSTESTLNQTQVNSKQSQDDYKASLIKATTDNTNKPIVLDKQSEINMEVFPPLTSTAQESKQFPSNNQAEEKVLKKEASKQSSEAVLEKNKEKVKAFDNSNKSDTAVTSQNQDKPIETEVKINDKNSEQQVNNKTTKKSKLEFLDFRGSSSVIFLDELNQNKAINKISSSYSLENDSRKSSQENTQQLKQKLSITSNVLNGIKFGFIDSSSSDDDETNHYEGNDNKSVKQNEKSNPLTDENTNKNFDSTSGVDDRSVITFMSNTDFNQLLNQANLTNDTSLNNAKSSELTDEDKNKLRKKKSTKYSKFKSNYASSKSKSSSSSAISSHRTASSTSSDEDESKQSQSANKASKPKKPKSLSKRLSNKKSYLEINEQTINEQSNQIDTSNQIQHMTSETCMNPNMSMPNNDPIMVNNSQSQTTYLNQTQQIYYYHPNQINPAYVAAFYAAVNSNNGYAIAGYPPQAIHGNVIPPLPPQSALPYNQANPNQTPIQLAPHNVYYPMQNGYPTQPPIIQQNPIVYSTNSHMTIPQIYYPAQPQAQHPQSELNPHSNIESNTNESSSIQNQSKEIESMQTNTIESSSSSSPKSQSSLNNEISSRNNNNNSKEQQTQEASNAQTTSSTASTPTPESNPQSEQSNTNLESQYMSVQPPPLQPEQQQQSTTAVQINPDYTNQIYSPQYAAIPIPTAYIPRGPYPYSYIQAPVDYIPQNSAVQMHPNHMINQPTIATFQSPDGIIQMPIPAGYIPPQLPPNPIQPGAPYIAQPILHPNLPSHVQIASNTNVDNIRYDSNRKDQSDLNNQRNYQKSYSNRYHKNNRNNNNNRNYNQQQQHHHYYTSQAHFQPQYQQNFHHQVYNNNQIIMPEGAPLNEYRGDFNLDEAAFYVSKQWNNVKQP